MEYSPASSLCAMFSLQGQVAVVTGASRGLGKSMATKLAEVGAHVVLVARSQDQLEANVAELTQRHLKASFKVVDCSDEPAINTAMAAIFEEHGKIDILVNNASHPLHLPITNPSQFPSYSQAGLIMRKPATETTAPEWLGIMDINLNGAFYLAREAARYMEKNKYGRIINTLSALSVFGRPGIHAYTASKHGLHGLTKSLAGELGSKGITVNGIGPGYMKTDNTAALQTNPEFDTLVRSRTPVPRWGEPEDMDAAVVFLCSPMAGYVNGHMLMVDGGFTSTVCNHALE